ncbi:MAG: DUF1674 domain-containing protein [Alphaproteobacteria bacterium]|nr:DUF1674 domain-containing protein [Alphaproteobacteria bacterium]
MPQYDKPARPQSPADISQSATYAPDAPDSGADAVPPKILSPAAQRALAEAAERRKAMDEAAASRKKEIDGRGGLDPSRYGDWEVKGIASDF